MGEDEAAIAAVIQSTLGKLVEESIMYSENLSLNFLTYQGATTKDETEPSDMSVLFEELLSTLGLDRATLIPPPPLTFTGDYTKIDDNPLHVSYSTASNTNL
jgi:hypothetical protein